MARSFRDNTQLEVFRDITDDVVESDFVPYACLLDPHTILTKNGEVLQVIKITGFTYEAVQHGNADLRQVVRHAIAQAIPDDRYAIWFHTLRRRKRLSADANYPDPFSHHVHEAWKERNNWDRKYINELYVTIVREGQMANIANANSFFEGLIPARDRAKRNAYIDQSMQALEQTVNDVLQHLQAFGAKRLGVVERDGVYYGEHLEFLEKLINLEERQMPIDQVDLSDYLTGGEITFAYNAMEVRTVEEERRFGALLTVKEYKESSLYKIDQFLQLPCEFIVSQCVNFVNSKQALKNYQDQHYYMRVSGDHELAKNSELSDILSFDRGRSTDYGEQQLSIFVIGLSTKELEENLKEIRRELSEVGLVVVREDLKMEEGFWAQLPANFEFLSRLNYTNTGHIAGFVNIQNYPAGNALGCPWGPPVTLFYTAAGTPYFFNFHYEQNGHTSVVGPRGSGKSVLMNFLITEARKYRNRLFYIDAYGHAKRFIEEIGGNYFDMSQPQEGARLNPLALADSKPNREFIAMWLGTLLDASGRSVNDQLLGFLRQIVDKLYAQPNEGRTLKFVSSCLQEQDPHLASKLSDWMGDGQYAHFFDHMTESVEPKNGIIGFNVASIMDKPHVLVPVASYLMHRMTMTLDGTPSIFVLDEAWKLLNTPLFAPRLNGWLDFMTSKNALAILATEDVDDTVNYAYSESVMTMMATQIYLPDDDPSDVYQSVFNLSDEEYAYIEAMNVQYRHFLLKRGNETIVAELNLGGMEDILAVLSGMGEVSEAETPVAEESPSMMQSSDSIWDEESA